MIEPGRAFGMLGDEGRFGVYVHWPFCAAKCPYCDFNSHVRRGIDQKPYARALATEIAHMATLAPGRTVGSIFFGGGTPSLMEPQTVSAVLEAIAARWPVADDVEVTLEANPTSVEAGRFRAYREAGVNRVSLGVQALRDDVLKFLGRLHDRAEALAALKVARSTFERVSFDMIYARPGQAEAEWREELDEACSFAGEHLSLYQLTIEPETPFAALHARGRLVVPEDDAARGLYDVTLETTAARGLPAYEISNHARPGAECRHNLVYWRGGEWAGVGPGAHGRLNLDMGRSAVSTIRSPEAWRAAVEAHGHGIEDRTPLTPAEVADEFLVMGLRLIDGVDADRYRALAGKPFNPGRIADLVGYGLLEELPGHRLRATPAGFAVLNAVVANLAA
ncbi:radical SAM family heme chaperone HemW [Microbaculum sp. FT89]|uniref:radical SAM family heme chaperone HemW n=1 Tax=Microbaculum sp. FT89 TaxID=3447298 RepID=UPI003F538F1E